MDKIRELMKDTMSEYIGLEITDIGDDYVTGTIPVDHRTRQHMGIVHGGASVVLAETLGSLASNLSCAPDQFVVGLDINANHVRPGKPPLLTGVARPHHIGTKTMVWSIEIKDSDDKLVCISRLTTAVLDEG